MQCGTKFNEQMATGGEQRDATNGDVLSFPVL